MMTRADRSRRRVAATTTTRLLAVLATIVGLASALMAAPAEALLPPAEVQRVESAKPDLSWKPTRTVAPTPGTAESFDYDSAMTPAADAGPLSDPKDRFIAPRTPGDCGLPVFMPGGDTPNTTAHIVDALSSNSGWSVLTRASHLDSTTSRQWYRGDSRCAGEVGDALSCDEYPFHKSRQGGPGASSRLVPGWEQDKQGGFLSAFYGACGIGQGENYVVAPMPSQPTTTFAC